MPTKKDREKAKKPLLHEDHGFPLTRREFVAAGLIEGLSLVAAPTVVSLISGPRNAFAASDPKRVAFLEDTLAGGASLVHQSPPMDQGGQALADYTFAGRPGALPNDLDTTFDMPFFVDDNIRANDENGMIKGILSVLKDGAGNFTTEGAEVVRLTKAAKVVGPSGDDRSSNPLAFSHFAQYLAIDVLGGKYDAKGVGDGGPTGGRHASPIQMSKYVPLNMTNVSVAQNLFTYGGAISSLSDEQKLAIARGTKRFSETFNFNTVPNSSFLRELMGKSYDDMIAAVQNTQIDPDPRNDPLYQRVFGIDSGTNGGSGAARDAAITKLVLDGHCPVGTFESGGYDYHNSTLTTQAQRQFEAGQRIGRKLLALQGKGKPGVIMVTTDGSTDWNMRDIGGGTMAFVPTSDGGQYGCQFIFAIGATQPASYTLGANHALRYQRGFSSSTGKSDNSTPVQAQFAIMMATYMHAIGHLDKYPQVFADGDPLQGQDLSTVAIFNPLV